MIWRAPGSVRLVRRPSQISTTDRVRTLKRIWAVFVLEIEHYDLCHKALRTFRNGFADYLIHEVSTAAGCTVILTFDKNAHKSNGFARL